MNVIFHRFLKNQADLDSLELLLKKNAVEQNVVSRHLEHFVCKMFAPHPFAVRRIWLNECCRVRAAAAAKTTWLLASSHEQDSRSFRFEARCKCGQLSLFFVSFLLLICIYSRCDFSVFPICFSFERRNRIEGHVSVSLCVD